MTRPPLSSFVGTSTPNRPPLSSFLRTPPPEPFVPEIGSAGQSLTRKPGSTVAGDIYDIATKLPGAQIGKGIGNSAFAIWQSLAQRSMEPIRQANAENNANIGRIVGDTVQAVATPASLVIGGPAGAGALRFLGRTGVHASFGGAVVGGNTAARGGTAGEVAFNTAIGTATAGALSAGVGGAIAARNFFKGGGDEKIIEQLTPRLTPTKYSAAGKTGKLEPPSLFSPGGVSADAPEVQRAFRGVQEAATALGKPVDDIIQTGATASATGNLNNVNRTIGEFSEDIVRPFLQKNPVPTNFEDFINYIKEVKPPQAIRADANTLETFNRVRERVISDVYKSLKTQSKASDEFGSLTDPNIYWNARKRIDAIIEEELGAKVLSDPSRTGVKAAAASLRQGMADFLSDMLRFPGQMEQAARYREVVNTLHKNGFELGQQEYQSLAEQMGLNPTGAAVANQWDAYMGTLSGLYRASDNLATKVSREQGKTGFDLLLRKHPTVRKAVQYSAGAIGAGALFGTGQNLTRD